MRCLSLVLPALSFGCSVVHAVPTWEGLTTWSADVETLVPGTTYIEALGYANGQLHNERRSYVYLSVTTEAPGLPGNATVRYTTSPTVWHIRGDRMWQFNNETSILPMNVLNVTRTADGPLQLAVGADKRMRKYVIPGGLWMWKGTMLYYDNPSVGGTNQGMYYLCVSTGELTSGLYIFLKPSPAPKGCHIVTLHSFGRNW